MGISLQDSVTWDLVLILTLASPVSPVVGNRLGSPSVEGTIFSMQGMMECASPASDARDRFGPSVDSKSHCYVSKTERRSDFLLPEVGQAQPGEEDSAGVLRHEFRSYFRYHMQRGS